MSARIPSPEYLQAIYCARALYARTDRYTPRALLLLIRMRLAPLRFARRLERENRLRDQASDIAKTEKV